MKKILLLSMVMLVVMALAFMISCSKDDDGGSGGNNITVVVNENGATSNGSIFSAIDDKNFYLDYIKYTVAEGHLAVTGYDKAGFKGIANIVSRITYKGNTYEVLEIGNGYMFQGCSSLTSVSIPNSVTKIGYAAFEGCTGLKSITIPNGVTSISGNAFKRCSSLTSVSIPNSVTSIGYNVFSDCGGLTSIKVENGNTVYDSRNNCNAIIETSTNTLVVGCKNTTIPNDVTSIGTSAFEGCIGLESITIPNGVTSIDYTAFRYCNGLISITIPNSVTSIKEGVFKGCSSLTSIHCKGNTPPNSDRLDNYDEIVYQNATLYVPKGSIKAYRGSYPWFLFEHIVEE